MEAIKFLQNNIPARAFSGYTTINAIPSDGIWELLLTFETDEEISSYCAEAKRCSVAAMDLEDDDQECFDTIQSWIMVRRNAMEVAALNRFLNSPEGEIIWEAYQQLKKLTKNNVKNS